MCGWYPRRAGLPGLVQQSTRHLLVPLGRCGNELVWRNARTRCHRCAPSESSAFQEVASLGTQGTRTCEADKAGQACPGEVVLEQQAARAARAGTLQQGRRSAPSKTPMGTTPKRRRLRQRSKTTCAPAITRLSTQQRQLGANHPGYSFYSSPVGVHRTESRGADGTSRAL